MSKSVVILAASATLIIGVALYYLIESRKKKKSEDITKKTNGVLPKETFVGGNKSSIDTTKTLHDEIHSKPEAEEEKSFVQKPETKSWAFTTSGHSRGVTRTDDLTAALNAGLVNRPQISDVKPEDESLHDDHVIEWKGFSEDVTSVADSFAAIMGENPHQKGVESFGDEKEEIVIQKNIEKVESGLPSFASQFTESSFGSLGVGDSGPEVKKEFSPFDINVEREETSEPMSDFVNVDERTYDDESSLNSFVTAVSEKSDRKDDTSATDVDKAFNTKEEVQVPPVNDDSSVVKEAVSESIQDFVVDNDDLVEKAVIVEHKAEVPNPVNISNDSVDFSVEEPKVVEGQDEHPDTRVDDEAVKSKDEHQDQSSEGDDSFNTPVDKPNQTEIVGNSFEHSDEKVVESKTAFADKNESASSGEEDSGNVSTDEAKPNQSVDNLIDTSTKDAILISSVVDETSLVDNAEKNTERKKSWAEVVASKPPQAEKVEATKVETSHKTLDRSSSLNESQASDDNVNDHTFRGDDDNEDFSDQSETMLSGGEDEDNDENVDETSWTQPGTFDDTSLHHRESGQTDAEGKAKNVDKLKHVEVGAASENVVDEKDSRLETSTHL